VPQTCPGSVISPCRVRSPRGLVALLVGLVLSVGVSLGAQAATTWTVCASGCDYASIKSAIAASTTLDGDTLAIAAGTYTEPGILVDKSLTLQGASAATTIVQAAEAPDTAPDRVFTIPSGVTVTIQNLTIRHGRTRDSGGGVSNAGTLTLVNSTVRDNTATDAGGGLYNGYTSPLTLMNSTISGNTADAGGGLYNDYASPLTLTNSIVANNPTGGDCRDYYSSIISKGYNLDSDGSCQLTAPTDLPGVDPRLGPLQDNGGPTFTQALLPGSPAVDAIPWGTNGCGTTHIGDQRWQARPQPAGGACDIGAYEVVVAGQALSAWVTGFTPHTAVCENVTTGQEGTLSDPASPWDCEATGLAVSTGDQVVLRARGLVTRGAADVRGAVVGMAPSSGGCTNLTTGQQVTFQHMQGATVASCVAAGLVVQPWDQVQMRVQGTAE
jgi:hypothetical protein